MKLYEMYFSPTGGTKKIAEIIGDVWDCEKERIDLLDPGEQLSGCELTREDICIVAVPSYGGRVPEPAIQRIRKMHGQGATTVLAAVYGNRDYEDTLLELKDVLLEAGFSCAAAIAAVAEHSILHQFGTGRPDDKDRKELREFTEKIRHQLDCGQEVREVELPGSRPYRQYHGVPIKPKGGHNCNKCGLCAKQCPVHAIPKDAPSLVEKEKCISCMHCIAICPRKARHNSKILLAVSASKMKKSCGGRKENELFMGTGYF